MREELDKQLCEKYPKMMVNRHKPMQETCMCWGFECGDGWFNILDQLMANIQHHIDWRNGNRERAIQYNQMIEDCKHGDYRLFNDYYKDYQEPFRHRQMEEMAEAELREVPDAVQQVTLDQVKEKFGTLRFYYTGGDDTVSGMVRMAEAMSGVMCEQCGDIATRDNDGGWVSTLCEMHRTERSRKMKQ